MAEREYTDEEYTAIGNEFLKLIAPAMQQQSQPAQQTSGQQAMPSRQAMPNQGRQVNLPKPKTLKKFPAGTATKVKQVLQNYRPQMPQQPQQMVPPQFMPMQAPQYAGALQISWGSNAKHLQKSFSAASNATRPFSSL